MLKRGYTLYKRKRHESYSQKWREKGPRGERVVRGWRGESAERVQGKVILQSEDTKLDEVNFDENLYF